MDIEALVLIEADLDAQRMCVTWPKIGKAFGVANDEGHLPEVVEQWAEISGVDVDDIERLLPMLFGNDILLPEGLVDDTALRFIRTRLSGVLQQQAAHRR